MPMTPRLRRRYHAVKQGSKSKLKRYPVVVPLFGLLAGFAVIGAALLFKDGRAFTPTDSHLVQLNLNGQRQVVPTTATTVGEVLRRMQITLKAADVVEPALDAEIYDDNFKVNVYYAKPVTIVDRGHKQTAVSAARTPRLVAEGAGLTVYPEDKVNFERGSLEENIIGEKVVIERATPVALNLYGTSLALRTHSQTVADLLKEKAVVLAAGDNVQPAPETPLTANSQVFVTRQGVQITIIEETIPAPLQSVKDNNLTFGATVVRQPGRPGKKVVTYQIHTSNGIETSRQAIQTTVTVQPVVRIIAVGGAALNDSLQSWLYKLRMCESKGNYQINTGNGYYGAYQFALSTWRSLNTGYDYPHLAPPAVQDQAVIKNTLRSKGGLSTQHPGCYKKLGLSNFPPPNQ